MRKNTLVAIIVILCLLIAGMSLGGSKAIENIQEYIETNKEQEIIYDPELEPEYIVSYVSSNNSGLTYLYNGTENIGTSLFIGEESLKTADFSSFVLDFNFEQFPGVWNTPELSFGLLANNSEKIDLSWNPDYFKSTNFSLKGFESFTGDQGIEASLGDTKLNEFSEIENLTFVFQRLTDNNVKITIYIDNEFLTSVESNLDVSFIHGFYFSYKVNQPETIVMFDYINLYAVSNDYDGDLYDVISTERPLSESDDFNKFINGQ